MTTLRLSVSSKPLIADVVDQGRYVLSASLFYFWPRNSQSSSTGPDELLDHCSYYDSMCPKPRARKIGVMVFGPNASFSSLQYFALRLLSDLSVRIETSLAEYFEAQGLSNYAPHRDLPLLEVVKMSLTNS